MSSTAATTVTYLETPDKSESDKKNYRYMLLGNGMRCLLVSDPSPKPPASSNASDASSTISDGDTESSDEESSSSSTTSITGSEVSDLSSEEGDETLAACCLLVEVGSFSEPKKFQGLAHFLEHMIFMGSKKYPTENAYDAHIKKCGGWNNANTKNESTLFYFEVPDEHLDTSMDYLASLLKAPIMMKEAMTRERNAVESEFQETLYDDEIRRDQILASLASPRYPHNTFSWGNLKSLKENVNDDELQKALHSFQKLHYSAHRMIVCAQARLPMEEIERIVIKHFSDVPSNNINGIDFKQFDYKESFLPEFHTEVYFLKAIEKVSRLELSWVLPSMNDKYKCKPQRFLSHLLGDEGPGSLTSYLRKRLWIIKLITGNDEESSFDYNNIYCLFNICIVLTDDGLKHLDEVLAATFSYIKLFSKSEALENNFAEVQHIEATNFRFDSQKAAFDNVQNLAENVNLYPAKDILTGSELYFEFNKEQIQEVLDNLNSFKFNIMIVSNKKFENITFDKKEKWFGAKYASMPMPQKWRDLWDNATPIPELHLPLPNKFISKDFRIFWEENGKPEIHHSPKNILQSDVCQLWFKQDDQFLLPEAYMYFYIISPLLRQSPKNEVMCILYSHLVKFFLAEELYAAKTANLDYSLHVAEKGIILKVAGYNDKLHLLVDIITKTMVSIRDKITEEQLEVYKDHQKKDFFNDLIKPKILNKELRLSILENIHWPMIESIGLVDSITLQDMKEFCDKFMKELFLLTLMQGNLTEEIAHNVMNTVLTTFNCKPIKEKKYIEDRACRLPEGVNYICCKSLNSSNSNSVICNFYQLGPTSVYLESQLDLIMMFVEEPLFDTLRTKEQLGYNVSANVRVNYGIIGYSICVHSQETKHQAMKVDERIESFRLNMLKILQDIPDDEFEQVRESLIKLKQVADLSLDEEMSRNWHEVSAQEFVFDRRRREVEFIRILKKDDLVNFLIDTEEKNFRKLSVQVIGNSQLTEQFADDNNSNSSDSEDNDIELFKNLGSSIQKLELIQADGAESIMDLENFKKKLHVYPVTTTSLEFEKTRDNQKLITVQEGEKIDNE